MATKECSCALTRGRIKPKRNRVSEGLHKAEQVYGASIGNGDGDAMRKQWQRQATNAHMATGRKAFRKTLPGDT